MVRISQDFTGKNPVHSVTAKASRTLGLLRRNLYNFNRDIERAYNSLVLPTLEYVASVWDPRISANVNRLDHALLSVHCSIVITWSERAGLLSLLCVVLFLCFCHFLVWFFGSGVVLNCINS